MDHPITADSASRFEAYVEGLVRGIGHADRAKPLRDYCVGLMMPCERKSVEPMAAVTAPERTAAQHQSLLHFVGEGRWSDEKVLAKGRERGLPGGGRREVGIIQPPGLFPTKGGGHSVGVARQYCGQLGKQDNCQVAVSLSVATWNSSLPIAYRLYLPEEWSKDSKRRKTTGVPQEIRFQTKPQIALDQIRQAVEADLARGIVLADAAYGGNSPFRAGVTQLGLQYAVGVQSSMTVWEPGAEPWKGQGRPPQLPRRDSQHPPVSVKELAQALPASAWKDVTWREGTERNLRSRFAALRVRPAGGDNQKAEPSAEEWLLIEWPRGEAEPAKYWLSTLPSHPKPNPVLQVAKHRWIIERDYEELKQELGLGHYEGRGWRGFHHHATLCIAAYGFLISERNRFSPSARAGHVGLSAPGPPPNFHPRGSPHSPRAA